MSKADRPFSQLRLEYDSHGRLFLVDSQADQPIAVVPIRAFPISDPDHCISICDQEGHEVLHIGNIADLPAAMRTILESELARREFVPVIERIHSVTHGEPMLWSVETDRGSTSFQVNSEDDVRRMEPAQASILDSHGIRYLIQDVRKLDKVSRQILEHFL